MTTFNTNDCSLQNLDQIDQEDEPGPMLPIFDNRISTDGYSVHLSMTKHSGGVPLPDLTLDDFDPNLVEDNFRLWGIDPGIKDIFTATDGTHQYLSFSTAEWRAKGGIQRRFDQQQRRLTPDIINIQSNAPTTKTAFVSNYLTAIKYKLDHLPAMVNHYGQGLWGEDRLLNYSANRRLDAEMVEIFLHGGKKYDSAGSGTRSSRNRVSTSQYSGYVTQSICE